MLSRCQYHDNGYEDEHIYNHHHDNDGARGTGVLLRVEPGSDDDDARGTGGVGLRGCER